MRTIAQTAIIIILFLGFNATNIFLDGEATNSTLIGSPLPWRTQQETTPFQFNPINLMLDLILITRLSELAVY